MGSHSVRMPRTLLASIMLMLAFLALAVPVGAAEQDNNILWDNLGHDSRDGLYRSPGGAVPTGTDIRLRLRAADGDLTGAQVRVWNDRVDNQLLLPMTKVATGVTLPDDPTVYEFWEATLPASPDPTVYWYRFIATDGSATAYYEDDGARTGGWGQTFANSPDNSWQLTIYDPAFQTPDWVKNAVIYQIFTDRFRDGDSSNNPVNNDFFYGNYDTLVRSGGTDWNTRICDPRLAPGSTSNCEGIWSQNFYGGDLQGIVDQLDYLQSLGVTALYLNPIFESPSNHKYDTTDFFHIDDNFGDLSLFQTLSQEAENRGMRIILDGVFNHSSSDSVYFDRYDRWNDTVSAPGNPAPVAVTPGTSDVTGACETDDNTITDYVDWYTFFPYLDTGDSPCSDGRDYPKWFGIFDSLPVYQHDYPAVRDYFINNGTASVGPYWMQWADGWRLDVAPEVDHGTLNDVNDDYWEDFRTAVHAVNPEAYIVGEEWGNPTSWTIGGEWDATMNYQFSAAVLSFWRDNQFVDNDFNGGSSAGELNPLPPSGFNERFLNLEERYAPEAFAAMMNLFGSHDTNRVLFLLDHNTGSNNTGDYNNPNYDWSDSITRLKGAVLMQMTLPGAPTIYYGDEVGTVNPPAFDGSQWQDDPYNRVPYPWLDQTGTPYYTHMQSATAQAELYDYYALLTNARNTNPALRTGSFDPLLVDDGSDVYAFGRKMADDSNAAVVVANGSATGHSIDVDVSGYLPVGATLSDVLSPATYVVDGNGMLTGINAPARSGAVLLLTGFSGRPLAVSDLTATTGSGEINLSWSATTNATSYDVYRSRLSGGGYTLLGNTANTTYTDATVANATRYVYKVVAVNDTTLLTSGDSTEVEVTPALVITWANLQWPPTLTHTLSATLTTGDIYGQIYIAGATDTTTGQVPGILAQVGYGDSSDVNDGSWDWFPMTFNVEVGNNDEYVGALLPDSVGTFKYTTRFSADNGATWFYAQNGPNNSADPFGTLTVNADNDATPPAVPENLTVGATSASSITLGWDAHPNTDGDLYGFRIYRQLTDSPGFALLTTVTDPSATGYTDTSVNNTTTYDYYLTAIDGSLNESAQSNTVQATAVMLEVAVTFRVTVPETSPGTVFIAGSLPDPYPQWTPGGVSLTEVSPNTWETTLTMLDGTSLEYKYTRGDWERVEKEADGGAEVPNRPLTVEYGTDGTMLVEDTIANWRDPLVTAFTPADGATDVPGDTAVTLTWNQAMPAGLSSFSLTGPNGAVAGSISYDSTTLTHTFTPDTVLDAGPHTATVSGAVDAAGGDTQQVTTSWAFTVAGGDTVDLNGGWFGLQWPPTLTVDAGNTTETVYAQIWVGGVTDASSDPVPGIRAQVGYGASTDVNDGTWAWAEMIHNPGYDFGQSNDEFQGNMTPTVAGEYVYTVRFSGDNGATWFYAVQGPSNSPDPYGTLTVNEVTTTGVDVTMNVAVPAGTPGTVYIVGSFNGWNAGDTNYAMTQTAPGIWSITFEDLTAGFEYKYNRGTWETVEKEADGNADILGGGNRVLTIADSGDGTQTVNDGVANWRDPYIIARTPAGGTDAAPDTTIAFTWNQAMPAALSSFGLTGPDGAVTGALAYDETTYTHTFTPAAELTPGAYVVTVNGESDVAGDVQQVSGDWAFNVADNSIDLTGGWFGLQWPPTMTVEVGNTTADVYAQIWVNGVTDASSNPVAGIRAQLGYGASTDVNDGTWTWAEMTHNPGFDFGQSNDEFQGNLTPTVAGDYVYTVRFSGDNGASWFYAVQGPNNNTEYPYGNLTVNALAPQTVELTMQVAVPAGTPGTVYVVGNFGDFANSPYANWEPGTLAMTPIAPGIWEATFTMPVGHSLDYKYTRGSWETVEKEADGNAEILAGANRNAVMADSGDGTHTIADSVANWRDPYPIMVSPTPDATDVPPEAVVTVTWNQAMPDTLSNLTITGPSGAVAGNLAYDATTYTHTLIPAASLAAGLYTVDVSGNTDVNGDVQQVAASWSFSVAAPPSLVITSFTLIDPRNDLPVAGYDPIPAAAVINLFDLPVINIRANHGPELPGSVMFTLEGRGSVVENVSPFAAARDTNGNYQPWRPPVGDYTLHAFPYSQRNATGEMGIAYTLNFSVVNEPPKPDPEDPVEPPAVAVTGFTLIDADTDLPVPGYESLLTDALVDIAAVPNISVRANTTGNVGSVVFSLNGSQARIENVAPYALFGDNRGDYLAWSPTEGTYTLMATPYTGKNGEGVPGTPLTITFMVVSSD